MPRGGRLYCNFPTKAAGHRSQRPPPPRIWGSVPRHSGLRRFRLWSGAGHAPKWHFWRPCGAARRFSYRMVTVTTGRAAFWAAPLRIRAVTPQTLRRIGREVTVLALTPPGRPPLILCNSTCFRRHVLADKNFGATSRTEGQCREHWEKQLKVYLAHAVLLRRSGLVTLRRSRRCYMRRTSRSSHIMRTSIIVILNGCATENGEGRNQREQTDRTGFSY